MYYGMMEQRNHVQWRVNMHQLENLMTDLNVGRVVGSLRLDARGKSHIL